MNRLYAFMDEHRPRIENDLDLRLPHAEMVPESLHEAMRYSVLGGGKRVRGLLVLMSVRACGGDPGEALPAASAIELLHAYSLIHDDLPCMDNAEMRRGKLACHKAFGEAIAVLAGDALIALAFESLAGGLPPAQAGAACAALASAAGSEGMVGGQVLDLEGEGKELGIEQVESIDRWKTGALIAAACRIGGIAAGASAEQLDHLVNYGETLGIMYQITDDLLDIESTTENLGKTAGQDAHHEKSTYPAALGVDAARELAKDKATEAKEAIKSFGKEALMLRLMSDFVYERKK